MFLVDKNISRNLWLTAGFLIVLGVLSVLKGHWILAFTGMIGCLMIALGLKVIPAQPLHVLLLTVWGKRTTTVLPASIVLLANYWPLLIDGILVEAQKQDLDYEYEQVRCKGQKEGQAGGAVLVKIGATFEPDYRADNPGERINEYLNSGGRDGVEHILADIFGKLVRNLAGQYTWEEFTFLKAALEATLLMRVADTQFRCLPRNADGSIRDSAFDISPEEYERLPGLKRDPLKYLNEAPTHEERGKREAELGVFLKIAQVNGGGDVLDLGIRITRLNVVKIEPLDELENEADATARQEQENRAHEMEVRKLVELATIIFNGARAVGDTKLTFEEALERATITVKRAQEIVLHGGGSRPIVVAGSTK